MKCVSSRRFAPLPDIPRQAAEGRYAARGVSASKDEVHAVVDQLDRGVLPGAFCKVLPDFLTGNTSKANIIHSDGAGTKAILGYLWYKETGDTSVFHGIAQDSLVMNIDDLLCVGALGPIVVSNTVNRNARHFDGNALAALIEGSETFLKRLREWGFEIYSGGGETADVGDITGTVAVDSCTVAIVDRKQLIDNDRIEPGLEIIGLQSFGQAHYETAPNSGIGSNGLTSARHDMLSPYYRRKFKETFDPGVPRELVYCGPYRMKDPLPHSEMTVGEALLSPTRTYAPVIKELVDSLGGRIRGLVHCSGGGQTKCRRFGKRVHYIKNNLFEPPPIFQAIQKASGTTWKEMYQVFNMGHRMEVYVKPSISKRVIRIAESYGIQAQVVGHTEKGVSSKDGKNPLTLFHGKRKLVY